MNSGHKIAALQRMTWAAAAIALCALLFTAKPAKADTFTFNDLSGGVTVSDNVVNETFATTCNGVLTSCSITVTAAAFFLVDPPIIGGSGPTNLINVADANGTTIAATLTLSVIDSNDEYVVDFTADNSGDGATLGTCAAHGGCSITATGSSQNAYTVPEVQVSCCFGSDSVDFKVPPDGLTSTTSAPEPPSVLLLPIGLVGLLLIARRKRLAGPATEPA